MPVVDGDRVGGRDRLADGKIVEGRIGGAEAPRLRAAAGAGAVDLGVQREGVGQRRLLRAAQGAVGPVVGAAGYRDGVRIGQIRVGEGDRAAHRILRGVTGGRGDFGERAGCGGRTRDGRSVVGPGDGDHHVLVHRAGMPVVDGDRVGGRDRLADGKIVEGRIGGAEAPRLRAAAAVGAVRLAAAGVHAVGQRPQSEGCSQRAFLCGAQRAVRPDIAAGGLGDRVRVGHVDVGEGDRTAQRMGSR